MLSDNDFIGVEKSPAKTVEGQMLYVLARFADLVVKNITQNLDKQNVNADSKLKQSVNIQWNGKGFELSLEDYWKFVDKGVRGKKTNKAQGSPYQFKDKMPPISALKAYIMQKGISIKGYSDQRKGLRKKIRETKGNPLDRAAFAMAKSIQYKGIRKTNFYSSVVNPKAFTLLVKYAERTIGQSVIFEIKDI